MSSKREPELARLWRHRPGRELVGMVEDVFIAKWNEEYRPRVLKHAPTPNGHWMMIQLSAGVTLTDLENTAEAIRDYTNASVEIRRDGERITVELFREELGREYPFAFDGWPKYGHMVLPAHFGIDRAFRPAVYDLITAPHLLIGGNTGFGKSNLLHCIVMSVLLSRRAHVVAFDPKVLEFAYLEKYADVFYDMEQITRALKRLNTEMDKRLRKLKRSGVVKFQNYQGEFLPTLVIIDELAELDKEGQKWLLRLLRLGRAAGISVVAAIQRPSSTTFDGRNFGDIKFLFRCRVCFACDSVNSRMVLDNDNATMLEEIPGRCIVQWDMEREVQNFFLPPDDKKITAPLLAQSKGVRLFAQPGNWSGEGQEDTFGY